MRTQAYLRVVGEKAAIRALHREVNIPGAAIKEARYSAAGTPDDEKWLSWHTAIVDLDPNDENRGIVNLLVECRPLLAALKRHKEPETEVILEVVTRYRPNEGSPGLYLSAESISLLSEFGGSLDHDAVPEVS